MKAWLDRFGIVIVGVVAGISVVVGCSHLNMSATAAKPSTEKEVNIDFVYAEGKNIGEPMTYLPIFTPQDGTDKGVPIYVPPVAAISFAVSPIRPSAPRAAIVTYFLKQYTVIETSPNSLVFTNSEANLVLDSLLSDPNVQERIGASITIPALGITNATYTCTETSADSSVFENNRYGLVFSLGTPSDTPRTALLDIDTSAYADYGEELIETTTGTGVFTNSNYSVRLLEIFGQPYLSVTARYEHSKGFIYFLSNAVFFVWEAAPPSSVFRNFNEAIPTDLTADQLKMGDFTSWRIRITGVSGPSLISQVTISTTVDSVSQISFSKVNGALLSDQKFILIPDGDLEAEPPAGYVAIRSDVITSRKENPKVDNVSVTVSCK